MSRFYEKLLVFGQVKIEAISIKNGSRTVLWDNHNTLTTNFFTTIPKLIAGEVGTLIGSDERTVKAGTARWVTFMKIGKGTTEASTIDTELEDPVQNIVTSSDLQLQIASVSFGSPFPGSVTFSSTLPGGTSNDDFNQNPLTEVGLFSEEGLLLARQVYPQIQKTPTFQLQYTWTITFRS